MATPAYTPLRHRMLREIVASAGAEFARYKYPREPAFYVSDKRKLSQDERDAVRWLDSKGCLRWLPWPGGSIAQIHRPLDANDVGLALKDEWDAAHPDGKEGGRS